MVLQSQPCCLVPWSLWQCWEGRRLATGITTWITEAKQSLPRISPDVLTECPQALVQGLAVFRGCSHLSHAISMLCAEGVPSVGGAHHGCHILGGVWETGHLSLPISASQTPWKPESQDLFCLSPPLVKEHVWQAGATSTRIPLS